MRARSAVASLAALAVDLAVLSVRSGHLVVLAERGDRVGDERWRLPWAPLSADAPADDVVRQLAQSVLGRVPRWLEQVGAQCDGLRHPSGARLTIGYAGATSSAAELEGNLAWQDVDELAGFAPQQRKFVTRAVQHARDRMDLAPVAFRLLPDAFSLSELQGTYELLLGRRLHKASFRRALRAASLVQASDTWRGEGRGRPAQLFRYAPGKRRTLRALRFDALG